MYRLIVAARKVAVALTFVVLGFAAVSLGTLVIGAVWSGLSGPIYDDKDPRHAQLTLQFRETRNAAYASPGQASPPIDFSEFNGGDWTKICIYGGYQTPAELFSEGLDPENEDRWIRYGIDGRQYVELPEGELAVAFKDRSGRSQILRFSSGVGPIGDHLDRCLERPDTELELTEK